MNAAVGVNGGLFDLNALVAPMGRRRKPDRHRRLLAAPKPRAVIRFVLDEPVKGNSRGRDKELCRSEKLEQRPDGVQLRFAQDSASPVATRIFRVGVARSVR